MIAAKTYVLHTCISIITIFTMFDSYSPHVIVSDIIIVILCYRTLEHELYLFSVESRKTATAST